MRRAERSRDWSIPVFINRQVSQRMPDKTVCVVIVNYNAGAMLTECVRSVLASTVPVKVCVSDNGSQDDSIAFLRSSIGDIPQLVITENEENLGFAKGNNVVLGLCHSEYVLVLNPDCIIEPDALERMIEAMERHPEAGMAGCLIVNPDGSEQPGCRRFVPTPWRSMVRVLHLHELIRNHPRFQSFTMTGLPLPKTPVFVEAISGAFMFVRRETLATVGAMDEEYFLHCEDLDWCMRFQRAERKILFVPNVRVVHWKGLTSKAHPVVVEYHKHRGMVHFYNKFFRHQYPGALMVLVVMAVWLRFVAKMGWIWTRGLFTTRHSVRPAAVSASMMLKWEQRRKASES